MFHRVSSKPPASECYGGTGDYDSLVYLLLRALDVIKGACTLVEISHHGPPVMALGGITLRRKLVQSIWPLLLTRSKNRWITLVTDVPETFL